jgi:hypothetical protein
MNEQLQTYARRKLKEGLSQCSDEEQLLFKRMYAGGNLDLPINDVVDSMEAEKLDWAMEQVQGNLYVCEREWWDLQSYCEGMPPLIIRFERDEAFIDKLQRELDGFCLELVSTIKRLKEM